LFAIAQPREFHKLSQAASHRAEQVSRALPNDGAETRSGGPAMPKEGSVAPKERVQITYKPATGDAHAEVELPLRILMMGDYTQKRDDTPLEERRPINISKDNLDEVMAAHDLSLNLSVKDELSGEPDAEMSVPLSFKSMRDFTPDAIAQQVPELRQLLELRKALIALRHPLADRPAFRKRIFELLKDEASRARLMKELGMGGEEK
jgi:type VI secretion system protein ImpB